MGRLASTWLDPVVGLDLHLQLVLRPPLPPFVFIFPHPYVGIVLDPIGLLVGLALTNAIGALTGGGGWRGPVLVNSLPVTNAGTESLGLPVLHFPYMGAWVPFPRITPPVRPGKPVKPPMPIPPNDAIVITGSDSVTVMGASMSRMGDISLSCSDPIRLPTSFIIAIPKGRQVLVGGGTKIDFLAAAIGVLRSQYLSLAFRRFLSNRFEALATRLRGSRFANLWADVRCFFTGHPVDVATGRLMVHARDWHIGGVADLAFERRYFSSFSARPSPLGPGWSHTFDEAVWEEPGRLVVRKGDGREIELHPDLVLGRWPAGEMFEPLSRLWLRRTAEGWETREPGGELRVYRYLDPRDAAARLVTITRRHGHVTTLEYEDGLLARIRDAAGRVVKLRYEDRRLVEALLPDPDRADAWQSQVRYVYSPEGDLVEVHGEGGGTVRYRYQEHLMVQEIDTNGRSFYFGYDGRSQSARCVRTWGDGGILDHVLDYDPVGRVTRVYDSHGTLTTYRMNALLGVTEIDRGPGDKTTFVYDDNHWLTSTLNAQGESTDYELDAHGFILRERHPDGSTVERTYDESHRLTRFVDRDGGCSTFRYDGHGRLVERVAPGGGATRLSHDARGSVLAIVAPGGRRTTIERDEQGNPVRITEPSGVTLSASFDRLGRMRSAEGPKGKRALFHDRAGKLTRVEDERGVVLELRHDGEGNVVERVDQGVSYRFEYNVANQLVRMETDGHRVGLARDLEGRVCELSLSEGPAVRYRRDARGRVVSEQRRDGTTHSYVYDEAGRLARHRHPDGAVTTHTFGSGGREIHTVFPDGTWRTLTTDAAGRLIEAHNATARVRFERDARGRIVKEWCDSEYIESSYDESGVRIGLRDGDGFEARFELAANGNYRVEVAAGEVAVERDVHGNELSRTFSTGAAVSFRRDASGALEERVIRRGDAVLSRRAYAVVDGVVTGWEGARGRFTVERDAQGRPAAIVQPDGTRSVRRLDEQGRPHGGEGFIYDEGGRVVAAGALRFAHDERGRLVGKHLEGGQSWAYSYDGAGRMVEATCSDGTRVRHRYDALGRRRQRICGAQVTTFRWDRDQVLESREDGARRYWLSHPTSFVPLAEVHEGSLRGLVTGENGAVEAALDGRGDLAWEGNYDLWGRVDVAEGAPPLRSLGQWAEPRGSLHYNHRRFYDADVGRYLTPDPIGLLGGIDPYGHVLDPLRENDPLGLSTCGVGTPGPFHNVQLASIDDIRAGSWQDDLNRIVFRQSRAETTPTANMIKYLTGAEDYWSLGLGGTSVQDNIRKMIAGADEIFVVWDDALPALSITGDELAGSLDSLKPVYFVQASSLEELISIFGIDKVGVMLGG